MQEYAYRHKTTFADVINALPKNANAIPSKQLLQALSRVPLIDINRSLPEKRLQTLVHKYGLKMTHFTMETTAQVNSVRFKTAAGTAPHASQLREISCPGTARGVEALGFAQSDHTSPAERR